MIEILSYRVNHDKIEEFRIWLNKDHIESMTQIEQITDEKLCFCFQIGIINKKIYMLRFKEHVQATIQHQKIFNSFRRQHERLYC